MDASTKTKIFEPFFTTKPTGKGTGMGLAMVYGIVKQNNGYVWVYSEPGQGATFKIYLPRTNQGPARNRESEGKQAAARGHETVLLAEDDASYAEVVQEVLTENGYKVIKVTDGQEALKSAASHSGPIHILITDVIMPSMNGAELAKKLRVARPELKALFISGYTDDAISKHGVLEEGVSFLPKPFSIQDLLRKVREVLDGR